jgi:hypothetical protein
MGGITLVVPLTRFSPAAFSLAAKVEAAAYDDQAYCLTATKPLSATLSSPVFSRV